MKILELNLSTQSTKHFNNSIETIISVHKNEVEPFHIISTIESTEVVDEAVPFSMHIKATMKVWGAMTSKDSHWTRHIIFVTPPTIYLAFAQTMTRWLGFLWQIHIADDLDHAYEIANSIPNRVR